MPGKKTNVELNQIHRKNTLKQPESGYQALCDAAKALHYVAYPDNFFDNIEGLFHVSTFTNGLNHRFEDQGVDLRVKMRQMIYELTRESNEAEEAIDDYFTIVSASTKVEKGSVNDKYNELKNYFTVIRTEADEYLSAHPADEISGAGAVIKRDRIDTIKSMRDYADAMLYNIDLKLQMRRDEETVLKKLKDLEQHPENLSATLDEIIEIESAYPAESRIHNAIEKICHDNLKIDPAADPSDREKYYNIGRPIAIFWETVTDEYKPNVYSLNSASYDNGIYTLHNDSYDTQEIFTLNSAQTDKYNFAANEEALKRYKNNILASENVGVALVRFNNALAIARGGLETVEKYNVMSLMRDIYSSVRQSAFGDDFANAVDARLKSEKDLYEGIVCRGSIEALKDTARAMSKDGVTDEMAANYTSMFLETLEKGEDYLTAQLDETKKTTRASDTVSKLYCAGAALLGDVFINAVDEAIENNKWAGKLMNYMAGDMSHPSDNPRRNTMGDAKRRDNYRARMEMTLHLFSKHEAGKDVTATLIEAYNAQSRKMDGVEELVASGKNLYLKEALAANIETRSLKSASFDADKTRSLNSSQTTEFNKKASIEALKEIGKNIPKSANVGVAIVRFNKALAIARGGLEAGYKKDLMDQMQNIYSAARQSGFGKEFAENVDRSLQSDSTIHYNTVLRGGLNILEQLSLAMKKDAPTPEQAKIFKEVFLETLERGHENLLASSGRQNKDGRISDQISRLYHTGATLLGDDFKNSIDQAVENTEWGKDLMKYMVSDMYKPLRYSKFDKDAEYGDRMKTAFELLLKHDPDRKTSDMLLDAYAAQGDTIDGLDKFVVSDKSEELKEAMFNRLGKELNAFKKAESAEAAMASYNRLQQMNLRTGGAFTAMQGVIKKAYDNAVEKFGVEITHYEDRTHMQDEVNDDYLQEFKDFSKEVRDAKSAFNNSTEYNVFSSTTDAYVSLVEEINRAKKAGEDHINISNLSSNAGKMARGILQDKEANMENAGRLMTKFSSAIMEAARNYEKYKMADHTLDPENEPNKKLLNKDDLRKMNLTHQILGKPDMPKDPKDLYKQKDAQKDAKAQEQSILM